MTQLATVPTTPPGLPRGRDAIVSRTPLPRTDLDTISAADAQPLPSLVDSRATLAIHRPDAMGLCLGCMEIARLARSPCPTALRAAQTVLLVESDDRPAT